VQSSRGKGPTITATPAVAAEAALGTARRLGPIFILNGNDPGFSPSMSDFFNSLLGTPMPDQEIAGHCHGNDLNSDQLPGHCRSCGRDGGLPLCEGLGSEGSQGALRDGVSLKVGGVVDGGVDTEKSLCRPG
jgi:hypothetical protein